MANAALLCDGPMHLYSIYLSNHSWVLYYASKHKSFVHGLHANIYFYIYLQLQQEFLGNKSAHYTWDFTESIFVRVNKVAYKSSKTIKQYKK